MCSIHAKAQFSNSTRKEKVTIISSMLCVLLLIYLTKSCSTAEESKQEEDADSSADASVNANVMTALLLQRVLQRKERKGEIECSINA